MNEQAPIHYIRLRTLSYSTENKKKVRKALNLFLIGDQEIREQEVEGNFGNKYWLLKSKIEKSQQIRKLVQLLKKGLGKERFQKIKEEIPDRVNEECSFFLRFDKQKAYKEKTKLTNKGDVILMRFKIAAYPAKKENAIEVIKNFL